MYIKSRFNHEVPLPGTDDVIVYNFRSHQFARLNPLQQFIFDRASFPEVSDGFLKRLLEKGMLTDRDEIEDLRQEIQRNRDSLRELHLSIDVNNDCNFSCVYCLETGELNRKHMSREVADGIIRFVRYYVERGEIDRISVVWFGGEPTLRPDIISYISNALITCADEHRVPYSAVIYTNGYNLTPDLVHMLERYRVKAARISVDGPGPIHDRYRRLKDGSGTFDRIIANIRSTKTDMVYRIRYNLNRENHLFYEQQIEALRRLEAESGNRIICSPERMKVEEHVNPELKSIELSPAEYVSVCSRIRGYAVREADLDIFSLHRSLPVPCTACMKYGFAIDTAGNISRCRWIPGDISRHFIGSVLDFDGSFTDRESTRFFHSCTLPEKEKCLSCELLPVCLGRCALEMKHPERFSCHRLLNDLDWAVLTLYNVLNRQSSSEEEES